MHGETSCEWLILAGVSFLLLTCIINSVPHLKTTDGAGFVFIVLFEDPLQTHEMNSQMFVKHEQKL